MSVGGFETLNRDQLLEILQGYVTQFEREEEHKKKSDACIQAWNANHKGNEIDTRNVLTDSQITTVSSATQSSSQSSNPKSFFGKITSLFKKKASKNDEEQGQEMTVYSMSGAKAKMGELKEMREILNEFIKSLGTGNEEQLLKHVDQLMSIAKGMKMTAFSEFVRKLNSKTPQEIQSEIEKALKERKSST